MIYLEEIAIPNDAIIEDWENLEDQNAREMAVADLVEDILKQNEIPYSFGSIVADETTSDIRQARNYVEAWIGYPINNNPVSAGDLIGCDYVATDTTCDGDFWALCLDIDSKGRISRYSWHTWSEADTFDLLEVQNESYHDCHNNPLDILPQEAQYWAEVDEGIAWIGADGTGKKVRGVIPITAD